MPLIISIKPIGSDLRIPEFLVSKVSRGFAFELLDLFFT